MNCKQGDLAVIVAAPRDPEFVGRIITCARIDPDWPDAWQTEPELTGKDGLWVIMNDKYLRPLRDNPGQDETLTWAPVPKKVEA